MIKCIKEGVYKLLETKSKTKILILSVNDAYAWINADHIGELLVTSHIPDKIDSLLAIGKYRLYEVKNEPKLTDLCHLELCVGKGKWQGYLLLKGLPTEKEKRHRIIPTNEIITKSSIPSGGDWYLG